MIKTSRSARAESLSNLTTYLLGLPREFPFRKSKMFNLSMKKLEESGGLMILITGYLLIHRESREIAT